MFPVDNVPNSLLLNFGNSFVRALIDSGSCCSILNCKIFDQLKPKPVLRKSDKKLQSVDGKILKVVGEAEIKFTLGGNEFTHPFFIVENTTKNVILGNDFLNYHDCRIFYDINCLIIKNEEIPMQSDNEISSIVRLKQNTKIKPYSALTVLGKVKERCNLSKTTYEICSIDNAFITGAKCALKHKTAQIKSNAVTVTMVNNSNKFIVLKRGCTLGKLLNNEGSMQSITVISRKHGNTTHEESRINDPKGNTMKPDATTPSVKKYPRKSTRNSVHKSNQNMGKNYRKISNTRDKVTHVNKSNRNNGRDKSLGQYTKSDGHQSLQTIQPRINRNKTSHVSNGKASNTNINKSARMSTLTNKRMCNKSKHGYPIHKRSQTNTSNECNDQYKMLQHYATTNQPSSNQSSNELPVHMDSITVQPGTSMIKQESMNDCSLDEGNTGTNIFKEFIRNLRRQIFAQDIKTQTHMPV